MQIGPSYRIVTRESLKDITKPTRTNTQAAFDIDEAVIINDEHERRKKQDRRKRSIKPLLDSRSGADRRKMMRKAKGIDIII